MTLVCTLQLPQWRGDRPHLPPGCLLSHSCRPAAETAAQVQLCSAVTHADIWPRPQCSISGDRPPVDGSMYGDHMYRLG